MSDPNTRPDWFLVYIVSIRGSPHQLGIRIDSDKVGVDILDRFFPDVQSGLVQPLPRIHTIPKVVRELGWFENINIFGQICQAQAVPAGQQQTSYSTCGPRMFCRRSHQITVRTGSRTTDDLVLPQMSGIVGTHRMLGWNGGCGHVIYLVWRGSRA
jgi:hypothetical protein